jgi:hypothetical protein
VLFWADFFVGSLRTGTRSMTERPSAHLEMTLVLPLGVIANQLMKIEADLRLLNMKAVDLAREREAGRHTGLIEERLERINEALDAIRSLVSDIEADIQPKSREVTRTSIDKHTLQLETRVPVKEIRSPSEAVHPVPSNRKPSPDQDD